MLSYGSWFSLDGILFFNGGFLVLFICTWVWNKDLYTRFASKLTQSKGKLARVIFRDVGEGVQGGGVSFFVFGAWMLVLNLVGCVYWYNWSFISNRWQIRVDNLVWYYIVSLLGCTGVMWAMMRARVNFMGASGEVTGVLALLVVFWGWYVAVKNIFLLVFILEIQGVILLYFIAILQMTGRSLALGRWWIFHQHRLTKKQTWQLSSLFFQFWGSFVGAIFLIMGGLWCAENLGVISWEEVQLVGGLRRGGKIYFWLVSFLIGLLVKAGLFPFHFWKPDVYKNFVGWGMLVYVSVYTFAFNYLVIIFLRHNLGEFFIFWQIILSGIIIGGFLVLVNVLFVVTEVKVFLAYMAVFHSLYILAGLVGDWYKGGAVAFVYVYIYLFSIFQFFGIYLSLRTSKIRYLTDFQQLPRLPIMLGGMICSLGAMSGLPPFIGFWGKLGVLFNLFGHRQYVLGLVCLSGGLVLLYFYLQNYRFIGIIQSGLLYRPFLADLDATILLLVIILGFFLNLSLVFFLMDLFGWSYVISMWGLYF